jgi:hypothetical protein
MLFFWAKSHHFDPKKKGFNFSNVNVDKFLIKKWREKKLAWSLLRFKVVGASLPKFNVFLVFIIYVHLHFGWTHKEACFATPLTPFIFFFYLIMLKRYIRALLCPSFSPLLWLYLCRILCVGLRSYLCGQPDIVRGAHNQKV